MRKALVFLLLASAAAPAFASAGMDDRGGRRGERAERAEKNDDRERAERPARAARIERSEGRGGEDARAVRDERREAIRQQLRERRVTRGDDGEAEQPAVARRSAAPATIRQRPTGEASTVVQERNLNGAQVLRDRLQQRFSPAVSRVPREGTQPPARSAQRSRYSKHHWRGDWRSDRRYDWRDHRRRYGSLFRFGFYRDPFGWGYQPFSIGWRMWPSYYGRSYWLSDPWQYRLPYAPAGYRWIRYYDDALLVDTWDGQVVDVIRNFFW